MAGFRVAEVYSIDVWLSWREKSLIKLWFSNIFVGSRVWFHVQKTG